MRIKTTVEIETESRALAALIMKELKGNIYEWEYKENGFSIVLLMDQGEEIPDGLEEITRHLNQITKQ